MSAKLKPEQVLVTPFAYLLEEAVQGKSGPPSPSARAGDHCPHCGGADLEYDGLLNLYCPRCHYILAGCFT